MKHLAQLLVFMWSMLSLAQITHPKASPFSTLEQEVAYQESQLNIPDQLPVVGRFLGIWFPMAVFGGWGRMRPLKFPWIPICR